MPSADPAIGNLHQRLIGTHHSVSREHLQVYLDELVCRPTHAGCRWQLFQTSLGLGATRKATHRRLIRGIADLLALTPEDLGLAETT